MPDERLPTLEAVVEEEREGARRGDRAARTAASDRRATSSEVPGCAGMRLDDDGVAGRERRGRVAPGDGEREREVARAEDGDRAERDAHRADVGLRDGCRRGIGRVDARVDPRAVLGDAGEEPELARTCGRARTRGARCGRRGLRRARSTMPSRARFEPSAMSRRNGGARGARGRRRRSSKACAASRQARSTSGASPRGTAGERLAGRRVLRGTSVPPRRRAGRRDERPRQVVHRASSVSRELQAASAPARRRSLSSACAQLVAVERQARRAHAVAAHADPLLHELDELHELRHRVHAQQRQEPAIERDGFVASARPRAYRIERHRLAREAR